MKIYLLKIKCAIFSFLLFITLFSSGQNSMTGDGFGGRSWYVAHNYEAGSYTAYTVCGVNNQLYGWGGNFYYELGDDTQTPTTIAQPIPGMTDVKFHCSGYVEGVIKSDNTAWVWGASNFYSGLPTHPTFMLSDVKFLDGGINHIVFVKNDGTVWGAGDNRVGELGIGTLDPYPITTPVQMNGITDAVRAIAVGGLAATVILLSDGTVKITGGNGWFSPLPGTTPVTVPGLNNIVDIKGGSSAVFALNSIGELYSFGTEYTGYQFGSLGLGTDISLYSYTAPTKITFPIGAAPIVAISANTDGIFALALDESGKVYGWGDNRTGQLGDGTTINRTTPELIATNVIDICAGEIFSYILKADNTLWASGASSSSWTSSTGSIWMNLTDIERHVFTQIDPTIAPMNLCVPKPFGVVLPIQLLNFSCSATGNTANLVWVSGDEINFEKYIVEYSQNGIDFHDIASIDAKGTNSSYNYSHHQVDDIAFYRLRMINNDGSFKYSEIRTIKIGIIKSFTIAPNPAREVVQIYDGNNTNIKSVQILSIDSRILKNIDNFNDGQAIDIHNLPKGIYILRAIDNTGKVKFGKFIKS